MPSLEEVARTCTPDEIKATTHAVLLQLARISDGSAFPEDMRAALALAMLDAGLTPESTRAEWDAAVKAYCGARPVRDDMLKALMATMATKRPAQPGVRR